jgi:capsular polysaccharide biosynthesis protein
MEIRNFFEVLWKWKSIFLLTFGTVVLATAYFTITSPPVYEATSQLIVIPSADVFTNYNDVRNAITSLDNANITNTYAEIAQSSTIMDVAQSITKLKSFNDYIVSSNVESQTSIVTITVEGPDPEGVYTLANVISEQTIEYVSDYFEVYNLQQLDKATLPEMPIRPVVKFNLMLGIILGLGASIVFTYLGEYLIG